METVKLRLTGRQHSALLQHLFPGDGKEAVALALCGVGEWKLDTIHRAVCVHRIIPIPYSHCKVRTEEQVTWSTSLLPDLLREAQKRHQVVLKIHSHPSGYSAFSSIDDKADKELFIGIAGWLDTDFPGISAVMLPNGKVFARTVTAAGTFRPVTSVAVAGPDIQIWYLDSQEGEVPEYQLRTGQAFGKGTTTRLSRLSVGVVGVSGTGSPIVEMLFRLGAGELVLVDGDKVEDKNLGRIYNSTVADVEAQRFKVDVLAEVIRRSGLPTKVVPLSEDTFHPVVVRRLAQCDVIFGCMDSVDGRDLLNRLCTFYSIPYFDLGVRIDADGKGSVDQVAGTVHYLQPDGSSLLGRRVYTAEQVLAAGLRRTDPEKYQEQVRAKYITGVQEDRPAVISVNTLIASFAVNDLLARLHPFRVDSNAEIASIRVSLTQHIMFPPEPEGSSCDFQIRNVGRGDVSPLLNMPILSIRGA